METVSFDAYLAQLSPQASVAVSLETLSALQLAHTSTFAFQSLSTVLHQDIALDVPTLFQKIVVGHQGGHCFELNGLFLRLLQHLGFEARAITGRVVSDNNPALPHARTHMALLVSLYGQAYLVDVGFGGWVPTAPLQLLNPEAQATPHGLYRIQNIGNEFVLSVRMGEEWRMLYAFDLQKIQEIDLEVANWFVTTHPKSPFRTRLMAARTEANGKRHALLNTRYSIHTQGQPSEQHVLHNADEVVQLLKQVFKINVSTSAQVHDGVSKFLKQLPPTT